MYICIYKEGEGCQSPLLRRHSCSKCTHSYGQELVPIKLAGCTWTTMLPVEIEPPISTGKKVIFWEPRNKRVLLNNRLGVIKIKLMALQICRGYFPLIFCFQNDNFLKTFLSKITNF